MKTLLLDVDHTACGASGSAGRVCAAIQLTSELAASCARRVALAKNAYTRDPSLANLRFQDASGPKFFGDDLLETCADRSDDFHDDFVNNRSAVMPSGVALSDYRDGAVETVLMVLWKVQRRDEVDFEVGWTAVPRDSGGRLVTEAIPLDYLKQIVSGEPNNSPCDCELPGYFSSGVPGILAHRENERLAPGAAVERCDQCQRYPTDEAALARLRELDLV